MMRKNSRKLHLGNIQIGGDAPISVQSMTKTDTRNVNETIAQIKKLESAGCEIIRVAVPDDDSASVLKSIIRSINIPLIADIHFDHRLAIKAMENGAHGIRINPGNIGNLEKVEKIIEVAKYYDSVIRIGVNSGSIDKKIAKEYRFSATALVKSALGYISFFEKKDFYNIKLSLKSTDVKTTVDAYKMISKEVDYPLHLGITEAGSAFSGAIKSSIGIGILLYLGIGDTIRVSLTADPVEEVKVGWEILKSLGLREKGPRIISCPTCGRVGIDIIKLSSAIEYELAHMDNPITVAVMGCIVNGPGEAKQADYGISGGGGEGVIFKKGKIVKKVMENEILEQFLNMLKEDGIK